VNSVVSGLPIRCKEEDELNEVFVDCMPVVVSLPLPVPFPKAFVKAFCPAAGGVEAEEVVRRLRCAWRIVRCLSNVAWMSLYSLGPQEAVYEDENGEREVGRERDRPRWDDFHACTEDGHGFVVLADAICVGHEPVIKGVRERKGEE